VADTRGDRREQRADVDVPEVGAADLRLDVVVEDVDQPERDEDDEADEQQRPPAGADDPRDGDDDAADPEPPASVRGADRAILATSEYAAPR
jgi:hypothetical protein